MFDSFGESQGAKNIALNVYKTTNVKCWLNIKVDDKVLERLSYMRDC
jgi:hypothetical protein